MTQRKRSSSDENDIVKKVVGKTKKGKELIIDQYSNGLYFIKFSTGGILPPVLKGRYVTYVAARDAIEFYLEGK